MVFLNIAQNYRHHFWLNERAIIAAKNTDVNEINFKIQNEIASELTKYKSIDCATNHDDIVNYPSGFARMAAT